MSYIGTKPADQILDSTLIADGTIQLSDLSATGTPSSSNYLRGDNTWASVASSQWTTTGSDIYYTTGSAGIGTSSPQDTLHVQGISRIQSTAGAACYWRYDNTVNSGGKIWRLGDGISAHGTFSLYNQTDSAFVLNATSTGNLQFNSGYGSAATAYGCRAWVNWNGTGTVAIRGSGNVSSITDNGTGQYTINFTTAMPDTNYSVSMGGITNTSGGGRFTNGPETSTPTTSAFRIICTQSGVGSVDFEYAYFQVFR